MSEADLPALPQQFLVFVVLIVYGLNEFSSNFRLEHFPIMSNSLEKL